MESVYAVFEVKPEFSTKYISEAQKKVRSVRELKRTFAAVFHKGGVYSSRDIVLSPIIGGILTTRKKLEEPIVKLKEIQGGVLDSKSRDFLNIGICSEHFAFDYTPTINGDEVNGEKPNTDLKFVVEDQLIYFAVRLFRQLQVVGSMPAIDMIQYESYAMKRPPN